MNFPLRVLVTRPKHQAEGLCKGIERLGAEAVRYPTLEILPIEGIEAQIHDVDLLIFISANAVINAPTHWNLSEFKGEVVAMGPATASAFKSLHPQGVAAPEELRGEVHVAPKPYTSEALLSLPFFDDIQSKKVLLVTGEGGRELLVASLMERGAEAEGVAVYQRKCPESDQLGLQAFWSGDIKRLIVSTSGESVSNLAKIALKYHADSLKQTPLLVVSARIKAIAEGLGCFGEILVAESAADEAVIAKIESYYANI